MYTFQYDHNNKWCRLSQVSSFLFALVIASPRQFSVLNVCEGFVLPATSFAEKFTVPGRRTSPTKDDDAFRSSLFMLDPTAPSSSSSSSSTSTLSTASGGGSVKVDFAAYANGYKTVFEELPFKRCTPSSGTIPKDLVGTYFRCGPAMFSAGSVAPPKTSIIQPREGPPVPDGQNPKRMVLHPFEGDGAILAVTFRAVAGNGSDDNEDSSVNGGDDDYESTIDDLKSTPPPTTAQQQEQEITARYRYVRTIAFTNERRRGQRIYRGMDSTRELGPNIGAGLGNDLHLPLFRHHLQPGLNKNRKNASNTRAVYWGGRLFTLFEGGQPYKLDGLALSTDGNSRLGGVLAEEETFGCKMVYDPIRNRALAYTVSNSPKSEVKVFEFNDQFRLVDEDGGTVTQALPGFGLLSDMAATNTYSIFVQPPATTSVQYVLVKEPGKVLTVEKKPSTIHLVPRVGKTASTRTIAIPFDGVVEADLQFVNAYETTTDDGTGERIILDAIRSDGTNKRKPSKPFLWPWASTREDYESNASKKSLWRYTIDMETGSVAKEELTNSQCYFGVVNPNVSTQNHRYIYMAVGGLGKDVAPPQGVAKFDSETKKMETWMPKEYEFCGEPMYAPRLGGSTEIEDDGYILTVLFNGRTETSEMLVFQAANIASGPVCRVPLGLAIPHGLHGCFTNSGEAIWSAEEIERRAKLADKMESRGNLWNEVKSDFSGLGLRFDDMEEYFGDSFLSR